jgi:hypothetical protein
MSHTAPGGMKLSRWIVTCCCALLGLLVGCATPYKSNGFGGGYGETQLAPDTFQVYFNGNSSTSSERARDFALLRAADVTLKQGFTCFAILNQNNAAAAHSYDSQGLGYTRGSGNADDASGETVTFYKPQSGLMIHCFRAKPDGVDTFDAAFLRTSIQEKYHLRP